MKQKKKLILIPDELPFVEQDDIINWSSVIASLLLIILIYLIKQLNNSFILL